MKLFRVLFISVALISVSSFANANPSLIARGERAGGHHMEGRHIEGVHRGAIEGAHHPNARAAVRGYEAGAATGGGGYVDPNAYPYPNQQQPDVNVNVNGQTPSGQTPQ